MFLDWKCFGHALLVYTEISTSESVMICEYLWYVYGDDMQCMQRTMHSNAFDICPQFLCSLCSLAFVVFSSPFCSVLLSSALFLVIFCSPKGRWGRCHDERSPVFRRFRRFRLDSSRLEDLSHIVAQRMSSVPELFIPPSTHSPWREHYCADRPHIFRVYSDILLTHCTSSISSLQAVTNP